MTPSERGSSPASRRLLGPRLVAGVLFVLALLLIVSALGIARGAGYTVVGPATIPLAAAAGLLALSAIFAARTTVLPDEDLAERAAEEERVTDWRTVGLVVGALLVYGAALDGFRLGPLRVPGLGYLPATAIFLPVAARILGSRSPLRDAIVGVAVVTALYFAFTEYLGVRLPPGLLDLVL